MLNGSPHEGGCTFTALSEVAIQLRERGIESEIVYLGTDPVYGCTACRSCMKTGKCIFDDRVNAISQKMEDFDALILGSPVYYGGPNGRFCALLDRLFYSSAGKMKGKYGASVVSCRRGGATAAFDRLNKYFLMNNMPVVPSQYWNQVHGTSPEDVLKDAEGLQTMRTLAENLAWMLKLKMAGESARMTEPEYEAKVMTNFIRK